MIERKKSELCYEYSNDVMNKVTDLTKNAILTNCFKTDIIRRWLKLDETKDSELMEKLRIFFNFLSFTRKVKPGQLRAIVCGSFADILKNGERLAQDVKIYVLLDYSGWLSTSFLDALEDLGAQLYPRYNRMNGICVEFNVKHIQIIVKEYTYCCTFHLHKEFLKNVNHVARYRLIVLDRNTNLTNDEQLYFPLYIPCEEGESSRVKTEDLHSNNCIDSTPPSLFQWSLNYILKTKKCNCK